MAKKNKKDSAQEDPVEVFEVTEEEPDKSSRIQTIDGVELVRSGKGGVDAPMALFTGPEPDVGASVEFTLKNNVTYAGQVAATTEADGQVLVEFVDGIKPVTP